LADLRAVSLAGLSLTAVLYVAANLLLSDNLPEARLDVTEDRLFTLSPGTHATLDKIDEPIELYLFYSDRLGREVPFYATYVRRVRELVNEIVSAANGKVVFYEYDPQPFSKAEDRAVVMGVQGIPLVQGSDDLAYFGLAGINTVDEVDVLPFFQPDRENLLEYDLVELIHGLTVPEPTVIGVISALPIFGDMAARLQGQASPQWAIAKPLTTGFTLVNLPQSFDRLPPHINVLMVVHPRELGQRELYEIEQFLFRGGRALMFLDPKSEAPSAMTTVGPKEASSSSTGLGRLLEHWKISVSTEQLLGDRELAWRINAGTPQRVVLADYVVWLGVTSQYMAAADPVTAHLPRINIASAGFIERAPDSPLIMEPLLFSSEQSAPVPVELVAGLSPDIVKLSEDFSPDSERYVLAARLAGQVSTAFPQGAPAPTVPTTAPEPVQRKRSQGPIKLILVADSDLLQDHMWLETQAFFGREVTRPIAENANFVINALENLSGSDELITLRSRGVSRRPFERVRELRQRAESALREKEQALKGKLKATQDKISSLEGARPGPAASAGETETEVSLSARDRSDIERLRREMLSIRADLRAVQRDLIKDVQQLETRLELLNIAAMPILIGVLACVLGFIRRLRRRRRVLEA